MADERRHTEEYTEFADDSEHDGMQMQTEGDLCNWQQCIRREDFKILRKLQLNKHRIEYDEK